MQAENTEIMSDDFLHLPSPRASSSQSTPPHAADVSIKPLVWEKVTFSYLYPYAQSTPQTTTYTAAACALFTLIGTDITLQQAFKPIINLQNPLERFGTLSTCFLTSILTFPMQKKASFSQEVKDYCLEQLSLDLVAQWISENKAWIGENKTGNVALTEVAEAELSKELKGIEETIEKWLNIDARDNGKTALMQELLEFRPVNQRYEQQMATDSARTWAAFLNEIAEKRYEIWEQNTRAAYQEAKGEILNKIRMSIYELWEGPKQENNAETAQPTAEQKDGTNAKSDGVEQEKVYDHTQRFGLAIKCIDASIQQLQVSLKKDEQQLTQSDASPQNKQGWRSQINENNYQKLELKMEEKQKNLLVSSTLLGVTFIELLVLLVLNLMLFPFTKGIFQDILLTVAMGVPAVLLTVYFFWLPRHTLRSVQKKLIENKRNDIRDRVAAFEKEQRSSIIHTLIILELPHILDQLEDINRCLINVQSDLQYRVAHARKNLLDRLNDTHNHHDGYNHHAHIIHICDGIHLEKDYKEEETLKALIKKHFLNIKSTGIAREKQIMLYKLLFEQFKAKGNNEDRMFDQYILRRTREKILESAEVIFAKQLGAPSLLNEKAYSALLERTLWPYLFKMLLLHKPPPTTSTHEHDPQIFICGYYPFPDKVDSHFNEIGTYIKEVEQYRVHNLKVYPVHARNEGWFFATALFRAMPPSIVNLRPSSIEGNPEPTT